MKQFTLLIISTSFVVTSVGQAKFKRNDMYLEAFGNGLFGSVNYERQLTKNPGPGVRIGVGFYSEDAFYLTIPIGINYLFNLKNQKSFIDAGIGVTWARADAVLFGNPKNSNGEHFTNFIPSIGYRRHARNDLMWRISLTPVANNTGFYPWLGFSIGKRF